MSVPKRKPRPKDAHPSGHTPRPETIPYKGTWREDKTNPRRKRKNPMARRRKNPEWWKKPIVIGAAAFVGVLAIVAIATRKSESQIPYSWWVESMRKPISMTQPEIAEGWDNGIGFFHTVYVPKIQNQQTRDVFTLPDEITEAGAEQAAQSEIRNRGGIPQAGKPTQSISPQAQVQA